MSAVFNAQFIPPNNVVEIDQSKKGVVTYQPIPSFGQINTQTMQSPYQNPTIPAYFYQNGQMMPVAYVNNGMNTLRPTVVNTAKTYDYANIMWSACNILCCFCFLGIIALIVSIITLRMRTHGDRQGARCGTIWATILNTLATISGIILIIMFSLQYIKFSDL